MVVVSQALKAGEDGLLETAFKAGTAAFTPAFSDGMTLADLIATEEVVTIDEVEAAEACGLYFEANENKRKGASEERKARKVVDTLPEGVYGGWKVIRTPNEDREAIDEAAVKALCKRLGIEVPKVMKPVAPSLKVVKA